MKRGFTLIELVVVMVIIGILVSLGVPQYITTVERGRAAEGVSIMGAIRSAQLRAFASTGAYSASADDCEFTTAGETNCGLDITIGALRFFGRPDIGSNDDNEVAEIQRLANAAFGQYTLSMNAAGTVTCANGAVANACARLGY